MDETGLGGRKAVGALGGEREGREGRDRGREGGEKGRGSGKI